MNTPVVMLVNVVLWSFGISAALLVGVMLIDWLANRRIVRDVAGAYGFDAQPLAGRLQQSGAPRRRTSAMQPAAKAA